jgi:ATP-dependent exoDNAse (exonuclease V) alpha subunit
MVTQHYAMVRRNLLYTGVTRGKRLVVLLGQKKAVAIQSATLRAGDVGRNWAGGWHRKRP